MNKIQNKASQILEYVWIIISLLSLAIAIQNSITGNWENARMFYVFVPIALGMFFFCRNLRKKNNNQNPND